ncbi:MAG TPA: substrate-binding domain-containing protein [Myxococcales bacterium]
MPRPSGSLLSTACLLALLLASCRSASDGEVVVFHDQGLSALLGDVVQALRRETSGLRARLEPSEGTLAVRKISEMGLKADLVVSCDAAALESLLAARKASWILSFATDEVVIAHKDHSRFTDEISSANWTEVLNRPGIALGCADPSTSATGAHAVFAWQLAGQPGLRMRCASDLKVPGEAELVGLLESRAADYVFLHRSTAEGHHLKVTALKPEWNLSRPELIDAYQTASLGERRGRPILCGLTVPEAAVNPEGARRLLAALLSEPGRRALLRAGYRPLDPPVSGQWELLPEPARSLVARRPLP